MPGIRTFGGADAGADSLQIRVSSLRSEAPFRQQSCPLADIDLTQQTNKKWTGEET